MKRNDIAIVCSDGGILGGFVAGALAQLSADFREEVLNAGMITASSASVGSVFYYLSFGEQHSGQKIWGRDVASRQFQRGLSSWFRGLSNPVLDVDYLVDVIFKTTNPLDIDRIRSNPIPFYFPTINVATASLEYWTSGSDSAFTRGGHRIPIHNYSSLDIYELIRAASAIPVFYDKSVALKDQQYVDGGLIDPYVLDLPSMRNMRKILISTKSSVNRSSASYFQIAGSVSRSILPLAKTNPLPHQIYGLIKEKPKRYAELAAQAENERMQNTLFAIGPSERLRGGFCASESDMMFNYDLGRQAVQQLNEQIRSFVKD